MSPGIDDASDTNTTTSEKIPLNNRWNSKKASELDNKLNNNNHQPVKLNGNTNNNTTKNTHLNGSGITKDNGKNHRWSPLPQDENKLSLSEILDNQTVVNNNQWKTIPSHSNEDIKNGWKEIPQIEELNGLHKGSGNNNGSLTNGNNGFSNINGNPDKMMIPEQDPLTGQGRISDLDDQSSCGIGSCKPKWAKNFASTHVFMVVFLLAWVLQVRIDNLLFVFLFPI